MKITQEQLQKIIQEEIQRLVEFAGTPGGGQAPGAKTAPKPPKTMTQVARKQASTPERTATAKTKATTSEVARYNDLIEKMRLYKTKQGASWTTGQVGNAVAVLLKRLDDEIKKP